MYLKRLRLCSYTYKRMHLCCGHETNNVETMNELIRYVYRVQDVMEFK